MNNETWNEMRDKIFNAIQGIETNSQEEEIMKTAILFYIYKSLENEETFNSNCNTLNQVKKRVLRHEST